MAGENGGPQKLWLYSPNGKCQYSLGSFKTTVKDLDQAVMTLYGNKIVSCGATNSPNCFSYDYSSNSWSPFTNTSYAHKGRGVAHKGKIYLPDVTNPEVVDLATKTVSSWAKAPSPMGCFVSWNSYILKFGADSSPNTKNVYLYDPSNDTWTILSGGSPFEMSNSGCVTLPNNNILISGTGADGIYFRAHVEFNVTSKTWLPVIYGMTDHYGSIPLVLGSRVFVIPGSYVSSVEEYIVSNRTVSYGAQDIQFRTAYLSAIAVPANWFTNMPGGCKGVY